MYDHLSAEAAVRKLWETADVYRYVPGDGPEFTVDTPPAYVSADHLHVGHAMSYSQPDFVVRYRRMRGERVFYPMGFDDNGLPTERYVEQAHGIRAADMPRAEFVALCLAETQRVAAVYEELWRRLGLSVDWSLRYSTIDERCQRTAQTSFLTLREAGYLRRAEDPVLWCPLDRTALAQADIEDSERGGVLHTITFLAADGRPPGGALSIATTRPELLPACVALYHHPADTRYAGLDAATVPLFGYEVPVRTDEAVDPEYGTGLMMVCSFGDSEDVVRWRRDGLPLRLAVTPDGRLNELAGEFAGLTLAEARKAIVARLGGPEGRQIRHVVGVHERCGTPVEFQVRPQWFIAVRDHKDRFRARAAELDWIPPFMRRRLEDWIDGLKWDWNISRQRRYGVPFPVWFCTGCGEPVLARLADLPVDPLTDSPPAAACQACGGTAFTGDPDVMDTWATSSLTPQITRGWDSEPMSIRVQGFEIIRTWLFYTVVQSELNFGRLPWHSAMIAGWGLSEQGRKLSKRDLPGRGNTASTRYAPDTVMEQYGADALRLWAAKGRSGTDLRYNEKDVRIGRKFAVKLWNVGRFLELNLGSSGPSGPAPAVEDRALVDRWMLSHLADTVTEATAAFDGFDYALAYQVASRMFWSVYCDRYLEMIKDRAGQPSAQWTLWESYSVLLGLFAPFAPFVTEDMYQKFYRAGEGTVSLHVTSWPAAGSGWPSDRVAGDQLAVILDATRALRSQQRLGGGTRLSALTLQAHDQAARSLLDQVAEPLRVAARADAVRFGEAEYPSGVDGITVAIAPPGALAGRAYGVMAGAGAGAGMAAGGGVAELADNAEDFRFAEVLPSYTYGNSPQSGKPPH
jgi:valyl-tRNA synthetase